MKKRLLIFLIVVCVILSACKKTDVNKPDDVADNPDTGTTNYTLIYGEALGEVYKFIKNIDSKSGPDDGMTGIWEAALALGDKALNEIGYTFKDLNGDAVDELLIGLFNKEDDAFTNNDVYMVYTLKDAKPEFLLEGRSRSMFSLKDDGTFFYMGSNGAAYSIFGTYNISDNNELMCEDYYFTYPDESDPGIIEFYHNKTGIYFREESEKLNITEDDFRSLQENAAKGTSKLSATPLAELNEEIIEKAMEVKPAPDSALSEGEWVLDSVEVEGSKWSAQEAGIISELSISISEDNATYFSKTEYSDDTFEAKLDFLEEPLYEGCGNEAWSVRFLPYNTTFGEDEDFYATLIDENTLLLRHLYPFDGTQGVSHQIYTRK